MNLSRWEKFKTDKNVQETTYRNMLSYERNKDDSRTIICFPEELLKNFQILASDLTIHDAYYRIRKSRSFDYETLQIYMRFDKKVIKAKFTLSTGNDEFETSFDYANNAEENEEAKALLLQIFQLMQAFVEENSPKRLLYLSSPVKENFPDWIKEKERMK